MKYVSVRKQATAMVVSGMLLVVAGVCGCLSALRIGWIGVWQFLTIACLVAMIQLCQRYLLSGYEYLLDPLEELLWHNRLTVIRTVGKRRTSVFAESLRILVDVIPYRKRNALEDEYGRPSQWMDFCPDLFPSESYLLLFDVNDALFVVRLQCDAVFAAELKKRAQA